MREASREVSRFVCLEPRLGFPGGPGVKTLHFHCRGCGFHPWSRMFHMQYGVVKKKEPRPKCASFPSVYAPVLSAWTSWLMVQTRSDVWREREREREEGR